MDPLILFDQAVAQGKVPQPMAKKVRLRLKLVASAVARVEKASGIKYPPYYIEPTLPVSKGGAEYGQMGVMFARVIPTTGMGGLTILVQFAAALVAFGTKGTIDAVAAHEFTHYVDLVRKLSRSNVVSDARATTLYEASFADSERTVPAKLVFTEKALVGLVTRKFKDGLYDKSLNKKAGDMWISKNLPLRWVGPEENVVRLSMESVSGARFDPAVLARVALIEEKMKN
ncbi:MAG: hypothetical protein HY247_03220 [archaeon]|nr:MAG: hypothetical protein HY247_03220 [archaeon]